MQDPAELALDPRVYVLTEADIGCTFKVTVTPVRSDGAKVCLCVCVCSVDVRVCAGVCAPSVADYALGDVASEADASGDVASGVGEPLVCIVGVEIGSRHGVACVRHRVHGIRRGLAPCTRADLSLALYCRVPHPLPRSPSQWLLQLQCRVCVHAFLSYRL